VPSSTIDPHDISLDVLVQFTNHLLGGWCNLIGLPDGRFSTAGAKPEALAEHLVADVWNSVELPPLDSTPLYPPQACNLQPVTIVEFYGAVKRSKVGKAPGPDSISMDWRKVSPLQLKHLFLAHYNSCFVAADAPDTWKLAT